MYTLMGVAAWRVWHAAPPAAEGGALPLGLYAAQLLLNLAWQPLFFIKKDLRAASVDITGGWAVRPAEHAEPARHAEHVLHQEGPARSVGGHHRWVGR